jgi:CRP-like cAMP-binding protein
MREHYAANLKQAAAVLACPDNRTRPTRMPAASLGVLIWVNARARVSACTQHMNTKAGDRLMQRQARAANRVHSDEKHLRVLRGHRLFGTLPSTTLRRLAARAVTVELLPNAQLPLEKQGLHVMRSGCLMLYVGIDSRKKVIDILGTGDHFGLECDMDDAYALVRAEALMGCTVLFFPRTVLLAAEAQSPDLSRLLALALIASIRRRIADITSISLCSGYRRITDYLLELASVDIERDSGRYRTSIVLPAGKAIIAAWLNVTPEYFSRALHYLTVRGAIGVKGREIRICDSTKLRLVHS